MAIAPVNKFISLAVPVSPGEQKLYEVPTGTSALVLYAQVANVGIGQSFPTVTFFQRRKSRSTGNTRDIRVLRDVEIPPNDALIVIDGRMVLEKTPLVVDSLFITGTQSGLATVTNVLYEEPTGITTISTLGPHGFSVGDQITIGGIAFNCKSGRAYGLTTTIFPDPNKSYIVENVINTLEFSTNVGGSNEINHFYRPAVHTFVRAEKDAITLFGTSQKYKPINADYDPVSGIVTFTSDCTNIVQPDGSDGGPFTPTGAVYDGNVGIMTITLSGHKYATGDLVKFDDYSLSFTCSMDGNDRVKRYPRSSDPIRATWVSVGNTTNNTFEIDVGKSPIFYSNPTDVIYDPLAGLSTFFIGSDADKFEGPTSNTIVDALYSPTSTAGILTCTIPAHGFSTGDLIKIDDNSLTFTYPSGGGTVERKFPTPSDPISGIFTGITRINDDTFKVDVIGQGAISNTSIHTFVKSTSGGLKKVKEYVKLANQSLQFTCSKDNHVGVHTYPRPDGYGGATGNDPTYDTAVPITAVSETTITLGVGTAKDTTSGIHTFVPQTGLTITDAIYDPVVGIMTVTIPDHGLYNGDAIKIADNSLTFSCDYCGEIGIKSEKTYPRITDFASDTWLGVGNTTTNTFEVQVLGKIPSTNINKHTFVGAADSSVTRAVIKGGGAYTHTLQSATAGMRRSTDKITIAQNSLVFTCTQDLNQTEHTYPRATDPLYDGTLSGSGTTAITRADYNTFAAYVGVSSSGGLVAPLQMEFIASILENSNA